MRVIRCDRCPAESGLTGASLIPPLRWRTAQISGPDARTYELCPECAAALKQWLETAPPEPVEDPIVPASQQLLPVEMPQCLRVPQGEVLVPRGREEIPEKAVITDEDIPF